MSDCSPATWAREPLKICDDIKKILTEDLEKHVLEWHGRSKKEKNNKRLMYCQLQVSEGLKEMINRNIDIVDVFRGTNVLDRYTKRV